MANTQDIPPIYGPTAALIKAKNKRQAEDIEASDQPIQTEDPFSTLILTALLGPTAGMEFAAQNAATDEGLEALKSAANLAGPYATLPDAGTNLDAKSALTSALKPWGPFTTPAYGSPATRGQPGFPDMEEQVPDYIPNTPTSNFTLDDLQQLPESAVNIQELPSHYNWEDFGAEPAQSALDKVRQSFSKQLANKNPTGGTKQLYPRSVFGHSQEDFEDAMSGNKRKGLLQTLKALGIAPKEGSAPPTGPMPIIQEPKLRDVLEAARSRAGDLDPAQAVLATTEGTHADVASRRGLLEDWLSNFGYGPPGLAREQMALSDKPHWRNNLNLIYRSPEGQPIAGIGLDEPGPQVGMFGNASDVPDILRSKATNAVAKQAMIEGAIPTEATSQEAYNYMNKFLELLLKRMPK